MKILVFVTTTFEALHYWDNAPFQVGFLQSPHRHVFHVKAYAEVGGPDRQIEFIQLKDEISTWIANNLRGTTTQCSCEDFAMRILTAFPKLCACSVAEDDENGALVER